MSSYTYLFAQNMEEIFNLSNNHFKEISDQLIKEVVDGYVGVPVGVPGVAPSHNAGPKKWITNGEINRFVERDYPIPEGWRRGRVNCVFNDSEKQKEFGSKVDFKNRGLSIKKAWTEGKMDHRKTSRMIGDKNPAKRPEVIEKIRQAALQDSKNRSERAKRVKPWLNSDGGWGRTRMKKNAPNNTTVLAGEQHKE